MSQNGDYTKKEYRQNIGEEPMLVHAYAIRLEGNSTIHLYPHCDSVHNKSAIKDFGIMEVVATRICYLCRKRRRRQARGYALGKRQPRSKPTKAPTAAVANQRAGKNWDSVSHPNLRLAPSQNPKPAKRSGVYFESQRTASTLPDPPKLLLIFWRQFGRTQRKEGKTWQYRASPGRTTVV